MSKLDKLAAYDFHDSLLESISYDKDIKKAFLNIDFCNWKQEWYNETDEETSMISVVFENVSNVIIPEFKINSDEIIEFELIMGKGIKMVVFNDIDDASYEIQIDADSVEIIDKQEGEI